MTRTEEDRIIQSDSDDDSQDDIGSTSESDSEEEEEGTTLSEQEEESVSDLDDHPEIRVIEREVIDSDDDRDVPDNERRRKRVCLCVLESDPENVLHFNEPWKTRRGRDFRRKIRYRYIKKVWLPLTGQEDPSQDN
jgi:hypothetical protein